MNMPYTIRLINWMSESEDAIDINIIGPYPTRADRDRALNRLAGLPDVRGNVCLMPSRVPAEAADRSCPAAAVAAVGSVHDVFAAFRLSVVAR